MGRVLVATYAAEIRTEFVFFKDHLVAIVLEGEGGIGSFGED
jgi:hypothetical protein